MDFFGKTERFKKETLGKWIGDIEIPKSDAEEDWEAEREDDEE